jgi:flagellar basal body-associated protein FliL
VGGLSQKTFKEQKISFVMKKEGKKNKKLLWIILIAVGILILGVAAYFLLMYKAYGNSLLEGFDFSKANPFNVISKLTGNPLGEVKLNPFSADE